MTIAPGFVVLILVKATVILVAAGLITLALRRRSAAYRHTVWGAALVGVLVLPALAASLPSWYVGVSERQPVLTDDAVIAEHEDRGLNGATGGALDLTERLTPPTRRPSRDLRRRGLVGRAPLPTWSRTGGRRSRCRRPVVGPRALTDPARRARVRDALLASDDWEAAGHAYAAAHDRHVQTVHRTEDWFTELFLRPGPHAEARRARVLPLLAEDGSRLPDTFQSGPDAVTADEQQRRRMFGEAA
jgi:fermentation-respiration switch protein FrsA (DUF1100 family)